MVVWDLGLLPPLQNSVISEDKEISKELAKASKSSFVVETNILKKPSFGRRITIDDYFDIEKKSFSGAHWGSTVDEVKKFLSNDKNRGKYYPIVGEYPALSYRMYGCPNCTGYTGLIYIANDSTMHYYSVPLYDSMVSSRFETIIIEGLWKDGKNEEAINFQTLEYEGQEKQINYLISLGREDEALERFPQKADYINNTVNLIKLSGSEYEHLEEPLTLNDYLAKGDLKGAVLHHRSSELPEPLSKQSSNTLLEIADYIEDNNLFEKWEQMNREKSINSATGVIDKKFEPSQRVLLDIFTLGVPEVINQVTKQYEKLQVNKSIDVDVNKKRELICLALLYMLKAKEEIVSTTKDFAKTALDVQASKEPAKELLQQRLIQSIRDYKSNQNIDVPNCVMITGNNPYVAKDLEKWVEEQCGENINCVKLSSKKDSAQMYENILEALETAEENYQETNKRSVIFVNGMEKLLRNDINDSDDIATMKDYMDKAGRYFHSTIIFYAKEPNKLDPGTVVSHRVGFLPDCGKAELLEWRNV